jgi:hypothetical protein
MNRILRRLAAATLVFSAVLTLAPAADGALTVVLHVP